MAFYSSKCEGCTECSKRIVKETKYKDKNGTYTVKYYDCDNYGCDVVRQATKTQKKSNQEKHTYQTKEK